MNKKTNTLIFIAGATLFNIIIFFAAFTALMFLYLFVIAPYLLGDDGLSGITSIVLIVFFVGSIVLSFFIYRIAINLFIKKINLEKYFDPVFININKKKQDAK
jgi:hypothetical protein